MMMQRPSIMAKVGEVGGTSVLSIPTIALAEARRGITIMPAGARKERLLATLGRFIATGIDVRPFTEEAAIVFSEAGAKLDAAGVGIGFPDLCIASVAIAENKTLISNDGIFAHVQRVCGLRFERWEP
jgi:predicted nucleic acid-binding protein